MLRFTKLEIQNFGPYQERQTIDFPADDGVVIVWGDNGYGKTTILKALRYALWGKIVDEHNVEEPLFTYVNDEAVERGEDMEIVLHMTYEGEDYALTRCLTRRENTSGESDADYIFEVFLQKGNDIVSPEERDHFLRTAIPEAISRFYLFDGELLQQYENLLKSENDNSVIKDSIEDILGLPILEISKDNLGLVRKDYLDTFTKASTADERTKQAGIKLKALEEKEEEIKKSIAELDNDLKTAAKDLSDVDSKLDDTETYRNYTQEIKSLEAVIKSEKERLATLKEQVKDELDLLWESHMRAIVAKEISAKTAQKSSLSKSLSKQRENKAIYDILSRIVSKHSSDCNCPVCNSEIDESSRAFIKEQMGAYASGIDPKVQQEVDKIDTEIHVLSSFDYKDNTSLIKHFLKGIEDSSTLIRLKELEKQRKEAERRRIGEDSDEKAIEKLMPEHDRLTALISTYKKGIEDGNNDITSNKLAMEKLRAQIKKNQTNTEIGVAQHELEICQQINDLFDEAIEKFKLNLKDNVQRDATKYFLTVSHNPDYKELAINEQYGLEILTSKGEKVPHRSSGYVQVVAISLIAALHKNAPISGPIIMDSTFQRIDPRHKDNVLASLPSLSSQVIVLAYPDEINDTKARNVLKGKLRKEVNIEQLSSFHSIIK